MIGGAVTAGNIVEKFNQPIDGTDYLNLKFGNEFLLQIDIC